VVPESSGAGGGGTLDRDVPPRHIRRMNGPAPAPAAPAARRLLRALDRAALGTSCEGWPYASLVLVAVDHDATPLLLLSDLAQHTINLKAEPRVSLLFDATAGLDDPLTGARVTVLGRAERVAGAAAKRLAGRYLARHPSAALYAGFADFAFYRIAVERAHLVAGFGRIHWIKAAELLFPTAEAAPLAAAEADIVRHMNEDHADAVELYATRLLGRAGTGWTLTGVDPEGADLRRGGETARLDFGDPVRDAEGARAELVRLVKEARRQA
jgi:heme oxygenase (biliverdin-IX-beta and delta-forming)